MSKSATNNIMVNGKVIVFIRTSSTARINVYRHLADLGYTLVMMHPGETFDFAPLFDHWIDCETNDVEVLERELKAAMSLRGFKPAAIVSLDEYGVYPAAQLCERFHFRPLPLNPEGLRNTTVKTAFRNWCDTHKIGSPKFGKLMGPNDDIDAALKHLNFPCVVKPSPGAGSMLTKRVNSLEEVKELIPSLWHTLATFPALIHLEALGTKIHLLVEEFVGGQEVDVDVVVENGIVRFCAISDNFEVKPPFFCEQGGLIPSALGIQEQKAIRELLDSFVRSHGSMLHGVLHFEAKYDFDRGQAYVIEVNVRPGSAETHVMVQTVYGVHLGECLVRLALGESLDDLQLEEAQAHPDGYAASVNVYPEKEGVLKKMELGGKDDDANLVVFSALPEGSNVAPPPLSFGMIAWMVASGACADDARQQIQRLVKSLDIAIGTPCCDPHAHFECDCVENSSLAFSFDATNMKKSFAMSFAGLANFDKRRSETASKRSSARHDSTKTSPHPAEEEEDGSSTGGSKLTTPASGVHQQGTFLST